MLQQPHTTLAALPHVNGNSFAAWHNNDNQAKLKAVHKKLQHQLPLGQALDTFDCFSSHLSLFDQHLLADHADIHQ
jgi:hypothetical protein